MTVKLFSILAISILFSHLSLSMVPRTKECLAQRIERKENTLTRYVMATKGCRTGKDLYCTGYSSAGEFSTHFKDEGAVIKILISVSGKRDIKNFNDEIKEIAEQCLSQTSRDTICDRYSKGTRTSDERGLKFEVETIFPTIQEFEDYADYNKYVPYQRKPSEQLEIEEQFRNACYDHFTLETWADLMDSKIVEQLRGPRLERYNALREELPHEVAEEIASEIKKREIDNRHERERRNPFLYQKSQ